MVEKQIIIRNKTGLHARPASQFVKCAATFQSDITIALGDMAVNAKSIMGVLGLGASQGDTVSLIVDGADESEAMAALCDILNSLTE